MSFYGYNFTLSNAGGIGALIYDVLLAYLYSQQINLPFGFVKEGYNIQRLNGSIIDVDTPDMYWHSYFKTFPIINQNDCLETWNKLLVNTSFINTNIASFSDALINKIFILQDEIVNIITKKIDETPFNSSTDIVLHIRQTDKIIESQFIPIEKYVDECQYVLQNFQSEKTRLYICTDDQSVCPQIKNEFIKRNHNIEIVWDDKESKDPLHELRSKSNLEKSISQMENYKWWSYATIPNNNIWKPEYNEFITSERSNECQRNIEDLKFCYRYKICLGNHYDTCYCISCKLKDTISSFHVTDLLCKIVGCRNLRAGEILLTNYGKDDFLSLHEDNKKGDIAVTFSLTYGWHPCYGGILHFCDNENNIYKSIVPNLGCLTIFDLDNQKGKTHFVSSVNVTKNRYTLTAWYFFLE